MANNEININIKATDNASPVIKDVQTAVANLGKNATMSFDVAGFEEVNRQISELQGKVNSLVKTQAPKVKIIDDASLLNGLTNAEKSLDSFSSKVNSSLGTTSQVMKNFNAEVSKMSTVKGFNYETGKVNTTSFENLSGTIANLKNNATSNLSAIASNATNSFDKVSKKSKEVASNIDNIGSRLRYLSLVMSVAFAGAIVLMKGFASSAKEAETSEMKLMVAAQTTGETYEKLTSDAQKLVSATGGMLNLADASEVLSNAQMALGDSEKSYLWALRMVDTAMVKKQNATDSSAEAVKKASIGLLTYREVMYDSAGAEIRFKEAEKEFAKEFNNGNKNLTERQKRLALYNATMKQTEQYSGMASLASSTFSGSLTKMNANVKMMQTNLGNALIPLFGTLAVAVDSTASKISNFSRNHSGLTMAIIAGTVVVTGFVTIVAGAGALVEMLSSSIGSLGKMFSMILKPAILATIAQLAVLIAIVGGLTYAWLKLTNRWDIWKNKMTVLGQRIKNSIDLFKDSANTANDTTKKLQKSIDSLQTSINDATADFNQQMSEWVADHDKNISKLKKQIGELKDEYKENIKEITDDWDDAMDDLSLSHSRKTEDLQEQIDEEVSKGIWADQTKIKNLKKELARENEDYALAQAEKTTTKDEQLLEDKEQNDSKLKDLQDELKKEEELEAKHSAIISKYRIMPYLDEVEKMLQNRSRQLRDQAEQVASTKEMYASESSAVSGVSNVIDELGAMTEEVGELQVRSIQEGIKEWWDNASAADKAKVAAVGVGVGLVGTASLVGLGGTVYNKFKEIFKLWGVGEGASKAAGIAGANTKVLELIANLKKIPTNPIAITVVASIIAYKAASGSFEENADTIGMLEEGISSNRDSLVEITKQYQNGEISLEEYNKQTAVLTENIKSLNEQANILYKNTSVPGQLELLGESLTDLGEKAGKGVADFIYAAGESADPVKIFNIYKKIGTEIKNGVVSGASETYKVLKDVFSSENLTNIPAESVKNMSIATEKSFNENYTPTWAKKWDETKNTISSATSSYKNDLTTGLNEVSKAQSTWGTSTFVPSWNKTWASSTEGVSSAFTESNKKVSEGLDTVSKTNTNWFDNTFKPAWTSGWTATKDKVGEWGNNTKQSFSDGLTNIKNNYTNWKDNTFTPAWNNGWNSLKTTMSSWASTISIKWESIKFGFSNWFDGFKNYWANRWSELKINLSSLIEQGEISLGTAGNNISSWYDNLFRASGGNVNSNTPYIVGEKGPELFVPSSNGNIIPNNQMGGNTFNINIVNPSVRSDADIKSIAQAVKDVISREMALKKFA